MEGSNPSVLAAGAEAVKEVKMTYGLKGHINTYDDYIDMRESYGFTVDCTYEQWVRHQEKEDSRYCKEWPREFKWTRERRKP